METGRKFSFAHLNNLFMWLIHVIVQDSWHTQLEQDHTTYPFREHLMIFSSPSTCKAGRMTSDDQFPGIDDA